MNQPISRRALMHGAILSAATLATTRAAGASPTRTGAKTVILTQQWDKTFPKSEKVDHQKVTFKNRYGITLAADLYLPKNRARRAAAGPGRERSVWRGEGAVVRPLRADAGGARIRHAGVRSVLHGRERRRAAQCRIAGHQHRGLQRGRRLPRPARVRRPQPHRRPGHLRLQRHGADCRDQ